MTAKRIWRRAVLGAWLGLAAGTMFVLFSSSDEGSPPASAGPKVVSASAAGPKPVLKPLHPTAQVPQSLAEAVVDPEGSLAKGTPVAALDEEPEGWAIPANLIDPGRAVTEGRHLVQTLDDGTRVELTLDPLLQRASEKALANYRVGYGALVALDPKTGEVLALAEYADKRPDLRNLALQAEGPAASIFKIVTAAALVETGHLTSESQSCTHGGRQRLTLYHLTPRKKRDKNCESLAEAMGSSNNVAFARWADEHLQPSDLEHMAERFLFNRRLPFLWGVAMSKAGFPSGSRLGHARAAAGFQGTTMSTLHAAMIAGAVANEGRIMAPRLVRRATRGGEVLYEAEHTLLTQAVKSETASELNRMMVKTVDGGSAAKYFTRRKKPRIPGVTIAGKTGSLSASIGGMSKHYSWFVAFAPAEDPEIAIGALVVNGEVWTTKGAVIARHALEAWFDAKKARSPGAAHEVVHPEKKKKKRKKKRKK